MIWGLLSLLASIALLTGCGKSVRQEQVGQRGVYHQVQRGQTLWRIAQAYGVDVKTLAHANRLLLTAPLQVGQRLYVPGATQPRIVASRCPCNTAAEEASEKNLPLSPSRHAFPLLEPHSRQERTSHEEIRFAWPIEGIVSRGFEQGGERRHDGVDILAPKDTPIRAAADGEVIFSDWGPGGYGRIVILRHSNGMVTLYAHNENNLVQVGQTVRQGDRIATVGKTGHATAYHVHFEIRQKTVPVPPLKYLSPDRQMVQLESR
jgi:murein DD-endopeptidase MepM/ murein hydrolase activator NlpD